MSKIVEFQHGLFETPTEAMLRMRLERNEALLTSTRESADRVRKGAYARLTKLTAQLEELTDRLELIERNICRGK